VTDPGASSPVEFAQLLETWADSLAQVLGQSCGSPQPCAVLAEAPAELLPAGDLWIVCAYSGGVRGEMSLRLPAASATRLARIFMGEVPAAEEIAAPEVSAEYREAVVELLRQVSGLVVSQLKPGWGEVQLRPEAAPGIPSWAAASTAWLRAGEDAATAALLELHLSAALVAALRTEKTEAAAKPFAGGPVASEVVAPAAPPVDGSVKLDLLMEVELALTLRFGSRRISLGEILDLNPGAVIDLDRQVQEPVDVVLDGRVVARGELVVIEGSYGLRVTEVGPAGG
jgi:flagellar motor switch protein FliN